MTALQMCILVLSASLVPLHVFADTYRFGVVSLRGAPEAMARWKPLADYFQAATGDTFEVVPIMSAQLDDVAVNGELDLILANPATTISIVERSNAVPLATLQAGGIHEFGGVILARKGSGIEKATDLKGKKVFAYQVGESAGGYIFQAYHLLQRGVDPRRDFSSLVDLKTQDGIVSAVENGDADAGFVRSDLLERMVREGKTKMEYFTVVDQVKDDYPFVHSTELYPDWFLLAGPNVNRGKAAQIRNAALSLIKNSATAQASSIDGFVEPLSLEKLKTALRALKLAPYDHGQDLGTGPK